MVELTVSEVDIREKSWKERLGKLAPRLLKATVITALVGVILLVIWFFVGQLFADYPEYQTFYAILAWATLFFTFAIKFTEKTVHKFFFIIARALFLIAYLIYATNGGILTLDFMGAHLMVEFIPILALMVLVNVLDMAKGILQVIEFTSESPTD